MDGNAVPAQLLALALLISMSQTLFFMNELLNSVAIGLFFDLGPLAEPPPPPLYVA